MLADVVGSVGAMIDEAIELRLKFRRCADGSDRAVEDDIIAVNDMIV